MLHILFLILKIIGIILAVILGILVLLICIVFFVPICYQGSGKCDGTLESLCGILKVSWLFNLLQVNVKYDNGKLKYSIRIAWKTITGGKTNEKTKKKIEQEANIEQTPPEPVPDQKSQKMVEESEEKLESAEQKVKERSSISEEIKETDSTVEKKISIIAKIKNKISGIKEKVLNFCNKIKCTIKNIYDKLKMLLEKKDKVIQFIQDKNHINAFLKLKKEVFKLLKRLRPKEYVIKAKYGFKDPSLTGKVLAGLSIMFPFAEDHLDIVPCFDSEVLQGRIMIKGRIYIIHFVCMAWNLIWCKYIRILYKDVRNFKL